MGNWAVAMTQPLAEKRAREHLEEQGFKVYLPVFIDRAGRKKPIERALFPRYLFVWIEDKWRSVLGTRGVSALLMNGEKPAKVRPSDMAAVKALETTPGVVELPEAEIAPGASVVVQGGPFAGLKGLYQGQGGQARAAILLGLLGRQVRVEVAMSELAVA